jgi:peptide/nickel transport system substrate-binding protein
MTQYRGLHRARAIRCSAVAIAIGAIATLTAACRSAPGDRHNPSGTVLRIGVGQLSATSQLNGLRQLAQIIAVEGLGRLTPEGRVEPWVADNWHLANGGRSLIVTLKSGVKFHDGSPVTAQEVASLIPPMLRSTLGSLAEDVDAIRAVDAKSIEVAFRRPSPFLMESLEVQIKKPGPAIVATGPYVVASNAATELRANAAYYQGRPQIDDVQVERFPSVRAAWAELLRNRIDMLWEVGFDALDSLESSRSIAVFTYVRHYQYLLVLNNASPALKDKAVRRALNMAVDRLELIRQALRGHGVPSTGPLSSGYWALPSEKPAFTVDLARAADMLRGKHLRFTCLLGGDQVDERMAIELKRQFAAVGADMELRAATQDAIYEAQRSGTFDAVLTQAISGPTALRPYQVWHSKSSIHPDHWGNATIDLALDRVRYAEDESAYRQAVAGMQQAFIEDPPAIFLAWSEGARAISQRFVVPPFEAGRDPLATLRLWTPRTDEKVASRN